MGAQQAMFDEVTGAILRDQGIASVTKHVDSVQPKWSDRAHDYVLRFIESWQFKDFTAEEAQLWAYEKGLPHPAHNNAWGGVFRRLAKAGKIEKTGIAQSKKPEAHGRTIIVWSKK